MKIFKFFLTRIFLKRPILVLGMIALLFLANYFSFTAARSIISTYQGYNEIEILNKKGNFIANLDPDSKSDFNSLKKGDTQKIYEYLSNNYEYAFQANGFVTSLNNKNDMEITLNYINKDAYKINRINLFEGEELDFQDELNVEEIPVLIGYGLAKTYPIGSVIKINDSSLPNPINLKVKGVLEKDFYHSNFYAPNSKNYFNFSIFVPVNNKILQNSKIDLQVNGLMDLILIDSTKKEALKLSKYIEENTNLKFNFFSQQENFNYFEDYYMNSLKIIGSITIILLIIVIFVAIWNNLMSIRLMISDITINLLVGLSYSKLRRIFYGYFGLLLFLNIIALFIITAFNRYSFWLKKDAIFATYGKFGLLDMDWLALLIVIIIDIIIGIFIVEISLKKIKSIPISLGVLQ
ncbi:ABC transporter permease [Macrococcoides canis]|uniref:ABC transporter permease n=1 Tax=Macrococcoides canis TaxID=1855823 RepID=UPI0010FBF447|nr:ABC transporter permease [Macrococcus canis]QCT75791.1 peptide ABC transporter permease [Macrococcus canis]QIH77050.1 peptide ABC transporter permease [Macrococcus canis]